MNEPEPRTDDLPPERDLRLARFHDGELDAAEAAEMEERLGDAPDQAETLAWYRRLGGALRAGAPAGAPAGLSAVIMRRIRGGRSEDHPLVSLLPLMRRLAVAAALLTAVTGAGFWLQRGRAEAGDTPRRMVSVEQSESLGRVTMEIRAPARGRLLR
jgi:anti-sigma factor RsiW